MAPRETTGSKSEEAPGTAGVTVRGSDFKFLALLHLRYPLLPYARLSALSSSPSYHGTLPRSSSDPSQILLASLTALYAPQHAVMNSEHFLALLPDYKL